MVYSADNPEDNFQHTQFHQRFLDSIKFVVRLCFIHSLWTHLHLGAHRQWTYETVWSASRFKNLSVVLWFGWAENYEFKETNITFDKRKNSKGIFNVKGFWCIVGIYHRKATLVKVWVLSWINSTIMSLMMVTTLSNLYHSLSFQSLLFICH